MFTDYWNRLRRKREGCDERAAARTDEVLADIAASREGGIHESVDLARFDATVVSEVTSEVTFEVTTEAPVEAAKKTGVANDARAGPERLECQKKRKSQNERKAERPIIGTAGLDAGGRGITGCNSTGLNSSASEHLVVPQADRGSNRLMRYVNAFIGCIFIVIAFIHASHPDPLLWLPYAGAAVLALLTLKSPSILVSRVLAVATASLMFFFFAGFFIVVPTLPAEWYMETAGWRAVCLILGAFAMIPILSNYSCLLKAECREARIAQRRAFFSVPDHIPPHS